MSAEPNRSLWKFLRQGRKSDVALDQAMWLQRELDALREAKELAR